MKYQNIREEELKNKIAHDYFWLHDCTKIIGNVDFCVCLHQNEKPIAEQESLLWAEAKKGTADIYKSIVQLILTIGKARTFDKFLPPAYLGAFDAEKIAFIPYAQIHDVFYVNDFNWIVAPSNHQTKEFKLIFERVKNCIDNDSLLFNYTSDNAELNDFIKSNFVTGKYGVTKTKIDKNNFMVIYNKWLQAVKPTIAINWDIAKKSEIIDGDFYLADLLSQENNTLKEKLFVLLKFDHYVLNRKLEETGMFSSKRTDFTDGQKAHIQFWNKYNRPPKEEYWNYIVERRDLLVPQDVRERKGSFFTPQIWVELSQQYIADLLGENWQDEYYIWDCAAGTGNLLAGLTNKYNIWASTLDKQDMQVMHDRIETGANLLKEHVFQFDFLNDSFDKLPKKLKEIIEDENKRKKLVVYINPPYAEAGNTTQRTGVGENKTGVSNQTMVHKKYASILNDYAKRELFVQFFTRVYSEISGAMLAEFSTLKILQAPYFSNFRDYFLAELQSLFVVPADSFDIVKGNFPIGFFIWNTNNQQRFLKIQADIYNKEGAYIQKRKFHSFDNQKNINDWLRPTWKSTENLLGYLTCNSNDFQNSNGVFIQSIKSNQTSTYYKPITEYNLIQSTIYFAVRHCVNATWLNDRDQFLHPNKKWEKDTEFQNDCFAYTLFSTNIQSTYGTNNWIPFTEYEVGASEKFDSNFMTNFIQGIEPTNMVNEPMLLFGDKKVHRNTPLVFFVEAKNVFNAGKQIWKYYHQQPYCNVNASLYDIRLHFQGSNDIGKMNSKSEDIAYTNLINGLRETLKKLAQKIEPKIYEYDFLKN